MAKLLTPAGRGVQMLRHRQSPLNVITEGRRETIVPVRRIGADAPVLPNYTYPYPSDWVLINRGDGRGDMSAGGGLGYNLTVGGEGFLVGFRPVDHPTNSFGAISPGQVYGERVWQFTANTSNNIVVLDLGVGGGEQPGARASVTASGAWGSTVLAWSGSRYEATDSAMASYLSGELGNTVDVGLS